MIPNDRPKRSHPSQEGPHRNASNAFRQGGDNTRAGGDHGDHGGRDDGSDVVNRAVGNAYRVFENYMNCGRNAAMRFSGGRGGGAGFGGAFGDDDNAVARVMTDMARMWWSVVMPFDQGGGGQRARRGDPRRSGWHNQPGDDDRCDEQGEAEGSRGEEKSRRHDWQAVEAPTAPASFEVTVSSELTASVSVELGDHAARDLLMLPLQASDGVAPALSQVTLKSEHDGRIVAHVIVTPGQPAGTYFGQVIDRGHNRPCGTVTVTLRAAPVRPHG